MTGVPFPLPRTLAEGMARRDGRGPWMASLPATVAMLQERWSLVIDEPFQPGGQAAWVAPARDRAGADLVLKVEWRHYEAEHEADGLRVWGGHGTVRLHAADTFGDTIALLLERASPGTALTSRAEPEQDIVIAGLLGRLWREPAPGHGFRPLRDMCNAWADDLEDTPPADRAGLDPGLAREGIALFRSLPATADRSVLLCTDLHAGNVVAAQREPWLVIDPKPYVGDPTYDVVQHFLNCEERLQAAPHELVRRMADLTGLDRERVLLWLFARCVHESPGAPLLADVARRVAPA